MFYSQFLLAKKGPLGKLWLAAHWDKRLTKAQIAATDIRQSVDAVGQSKTALSLRASGHLLLGVSRIYARKVQYLYTDSTEAFLKLKQAARPSNVDLDVDDTAGARIDMDPLDIAISGGADALHLQSLDVLGLGGGLAALGLGFAAPTAASTDDEWAVVSGTGGVPLNQSFSGMPHDASDTDFPPASAAGKSTGGRSSVSDIEVTRRADRASSAARAREDDDDARSMVSDMDDDARHRLGGRTSMLPTNMGDDAAIERKRLQQGGLPFGAGMGAEDLQLASMLGLHTGDADLPLFDDVAGGAADVDIGAAYGDTTMDAPVDDAVPYAAMEEDGASTASQSHLATQADINAAEAGAAGASGTRTKQAPKKRGKARVVMISADEETILPGATIKGWLDDTSAVTHARPNVDDMLQAVRASLLRTTEKRLKQAFSAGGAVGGGIFGDAVVTMALDEGGVDADGALLLPSAVDVDAHALSYLRAPGGGVTAPELASLLAEHAGRKTRYTQTTEVRAKSGADGVKSSAGRKRRTAAERDDEDEEEDVSARAGHDNGAADVDIGAAYGDGGDMGLQLDDGVDANLAGSGLDASGRIRFHDGDLAEGLDDAGRPSSGQKLDASTGRLSTLGTTPVGTGARADSIMGAAGGDAPPDAASWAPGDVTSSFVDKSKWTAATVAMYNVLAREMTGPVRAGRKRRESGAGERGDLTNVQSGHGSTSDPISFLSLAPGATRHAVAASFLQLLILKSWDIIDIKQTEAYGDVHIVRTARFAAMLEEA